MLIRFDFGAVAFCVASLNVVALDMVVINLMLYQWKREKLTNRCQ